MPTSAAQFIAALTNHAPEFDVDLTAEQVDLLQRYYLVVMAWNPRLHLVAPCSPREFATRHVLESLLLLKHLPAEATVTDIGSGAGLPIIPCLLSRPGLTATLIESKQKKAVFLKEALRLVINPRRAQVVVGRFEEMAAPAGDFLTCRALDGFADLLPAMIEWAPPGTTFLLYAGANLRERIEARLAEVTVELIPGSQRRFLVRGVRPGK